MPVRKRLLVLANSFKDADRCVAGRELVAVGGQTRLGPWVRPVSRHGRGELWAAEHAYPGGRSVAVLDVATVALDEHRPDPGQPENWALACPVEWADRTTRRGRPPADALVEHPPDLWLQPGQPTDRVTHDHVLARPPEQSLFVIRPDSLRLAFWSEDRGGYTKRKRRCLIRYNGVSYDLPLTDPAAAARYGADAPAPGEASLEVPLADALVCASLAGDFRGCHHKVAATVLEARLWQTPRWTLGSLLSGVRAALSAAGVGRRGR